MRVSEVVKILSKRWFVKEITVRERIQSSQSLFFEIVANLTDNTRLYLIERWKRDKKVNYSYYWIKGKQVLLGWDNSPHHKEISTFPHHMHVKDKREPVEWKKPQLTSILDYIEMRLLG